MTARIGVVLFPGSNRDIDAVNALRVAGAEPVILWHESADLEGVSGILLPGGFAYGDYLRAGRHRPVLAGHARPWRTSRAAAARSSGSATASRCSPRPGSCRGRCSATAALRFVCRQVALRRGAPRHAVHPRAARRRPAPDAGRPRRGLLLRRRRGARRARGRRARSCGATSTPTATSPGPRTPATPTARSAASPGSATPPATWPGLMPHPETARRRRCSARTTASGSSARSS